MNISLTNSIKKKVKTVEDDEDPEIYYLYGFLVHDGKKSKNGHYYSTVREANGKWFKCNDSIIKEMKGGLKKEDTE